MVWVDLLVELLKMISTTGDCTWVLVMYGTVAPILLQCLLNLGI